MRTNINYPREHDNIHERLNTTFNIHKDSTETVVRLSYLNFDVIHEADCIISCMSDSPIYS